MKRLLLLLITISLLLAPLPVQAAEPAEIPGNSSGQGGAGFVPSDAPEITGSSGIVMDMDTGDILYEKDCHRKAAPASTTKLLTAILAVDHLTPSDTTTVLDGALYNILPDAVTIALTPGEVMSVEDLLYAMLLPSANDAANVLAMAVSGTLPNFTTEMNKTAEALGCKDTHFTNANGLPDDNHYTTAYDMALIAREAYSRSRIRDIIRTEVYWIPATNLFEERELWTTNYLLYDVTDVYYELCTGGKTGYTEEAGYTMVAFAEQDGRRLVSVVFQCPTSDDRFRDASALLDFGLKSYHQIRPMEGFQLTQDTGEKGTILDNYYARLPHSLPEFSVDTSISLTARTTVSGEDIEKKATFYPSRTGSTVGEVTLSYQGKELAKIPITSNRSSMAEEFAHLQPEEKYEKGSGTEQAPKKTDILKSVLKDSLPMLIISLVLCILLCFTTIIVVHFRRKRRVNITRYFGDGPVPAVDPEAVAEIEERKRVREALRKLEDSGEEDPAKAERKAEKKAAYEDDGIEDSGEKAPRKASDPDAASATEDDLVDTGRPRSLKRSAGSASGKPQGSADRETGIDDLEDTGSPRSGRPQRSTDSASGKPQRSAERESGKPRTTADREPGIDDLEDTGIRRPAKPAGKKAPAKESTDDLVDEG